MLLNAYLASWSTASAWWLLLWSTLRLSRPSLFQHCVSYTTSFPSMIGTLWIPQPLSQYLELAPRAKLALSNYHGLRGFQRRRNFRPRWNVLGLRTECGLITSSILQIEKLDSEHWWNYDIQHLCTSDYNEVWSFMSMIQQWWNGTMIENLWDT